jgi:hypothetical protein
MMLEGAPLAATPIPGLTPMMRYRYDLDDIGAITINHAEWKPVEKISPQSAVEGRPALRALGYVPHGNV